MSNGLTSSLEPPVARITLDRPPLNVLTTEMISAMAEALERAADDERFRLVIVDARGKMFCAGVDVGDHVGDRLKPMLDALLRLFDAFAALPVPSVALLHGSALGGGCEVALGTDLCLASERAALGQPEIRLGVFAPPASVLLPPLVGERRALELLLTGASLSAGEARQAGLVNQVFPDEEFAERAEAYCRNLLELSGVALRQAKKALRTAAVPDRGRRHRALVQQYLDELMRTEDAKEGLAAFMEKRPPAWRHR